MLTLHPDSVGRHCGINLGSGLVLGSKGRSAISLRILVRSAAAAQ